MLNTILFDLDGTLLPMDFDQFMKLYFHHIGDYFKDLIEPNKIVSDILKATDYMIDADNGLTNEVNFMAYFETLIAGDIDIFKQRFTAFYQERFDMVQPSTKVSDFMLRSVKMLKDKGYTLVIATNPLFPLEANLRRLKWAGLEIEDFDYMSTFEENKHNKPHVAFYQEVLDKINKEPSDCMMVGNDLHDDQPAQQLGIKTYIVRDHMLNKNNQELTADISGYYPDFMEFCKSLPNIK